MVWAWLTCVGVMLAVIAHAAVRRWWAGANSVISFAAVSGVLAMALVVATARRYGAAAETWAALLAYAFACELCLFLFTLVSTSISAKLLERLRHQDLTRPEIDAVYDTPEMVDDRIASLLRNGFLETGACGYTVTRRGRLLLAAFDTLRLFFRHSSNPPSS